MTKEERKIALHCLKAYSDYHSEACDECINYPICDHKMQDDVTETIIKALEQESVLDKIMEENEQVKSIMNEEIEKRQRRIQQLESKLNRIKSVCYLDEVERIERIKEICEEEEPTLNEMRKDYGLEPITKHERS